MSVVKFCLLRASSSMVEQWPFKPLVESSSLSSLTSITKHPQGCFLFWLEPHRGMHSSLSSLTSITKHPQGCFLFWLRAPSRDAFEPLLAHKHHKTSARVFFIGWSPIEGCIRASPRSQASQNIRKGVFYWLEPHRGMHSSLSSLTSITKHNLKVCS